MLFTSECVTKGHPDKLCDIISDSILDACLKDDPNSRVACEVLATTGQVVLAGEITTKSNVDYEKVAREAIREIGYNKEELMFDYMNCNVTNFIHTQSPDIAVGVDNGGAGDQGMMFGGAVADTKDYMPMPISVARALTLAYTRCREAGVLKWARPDGKAQVTVDINEETGEMKLHTVLMSVQHSPEISRDELRSELIYNVIAPVLKLYDTEIDEVEILVNPTGVFVIGGPHGDTGLTGRKIIVDTYGGYFSHGGGAFSGKDPTKVDRTGAYMARYIAKNIVASGVAHVCEVQIAYAIGVAEPVSLSIRTDTTDEFDAKLVEIVKNNVDMTPNGIIERFKLKTPEFKYSDTARYGHFGDMNYPWEKTDIRHLFSNRQSIKL